MKKKGLLWLLASAFMLCLTYTSCDELEGLIDDDEETLSGEEAFFPKAYADKEVAAWYAWTEKDKDKTKTEAVFLFKDNTFVVTKNKVHTDGRYERNIEAEGTYELTEGDYKNGKARVIVKSDDGEAQGVMNVVIENGKLTTDQGEEVFTIQDNAKVPKAQDPASGDNGNNNGGKDNTYDDNIGSGAFFPKSCSGKSISAWYAHSGSESDEGYEMKYVAAIYFFGDGSFVATSNVAVTTPNGQHFDRTIGAEGTYKILQGNFTTGKIEITYDKDKTMTVEIENGQLKAIDFEEGSVTIYFKQDPDKVPGPSDPTNNDNQGGDDGGDDGGDESDVPAFFPLSYAKKTVTAWYSYTLAEGVQTMVEAVFLFDDNTLVVTEHKVFDPKVQSFDERYICAEGSFQLTGDFDNGSGTATIAPNGTKLSVNIKSGVMTIENINFIYTKRDVKDVPDPLEPSFQGDDNGGDNGGDDGGDDGGEDGGADGGDVQYNGDIVAYLPVDYANKTIAAWYMLKEEKSQSIRIEAVFLFNDKSLVVTKSKIYSVDDGREPEYKITGSGTYEMGERDTYTQGIIDVTLSNGDKMQAVINNGVLTAMEESFTFQDVKDAPAPMKK